MRTSVLAISILVAVMGLSACGVKSAADIDKDLQKKLDEDKKNGDDLTKSLNRNSPSSTELTIGGQPGLIQVSGIIVEKDSVLDDRITITVNAGLGINGSAPAVIETSKPKLSSKIEKLDLSYDHTAGLISIGCDDKVSADFAKERSLEVLQIPKPMTENVLVVAAKTVVLCGDLKNGSGDALKNQFLTVMADEIIFDHVDYKIVDWFGAMTFDANKVLLIGSNQLQTQGLDSSVTLVAPPMLTLNILKEISSKDDGKLHLSSTGSSYKADAK